MSEQFGGMDDAAMVVGLVERQHKLVRARFARSMGRLENTASIGVVRREIAQIKTELRRRELASGLSKGELERRHGNVTVGASSAEARASGGLLAGAVDKLEQ
jgi:ribosomal protein L29